ncbi:hypothetical protein GQ53DRAFT_114910 [Thozetella sp. PMI_491]|nr:hypothetical protein GQ53DRAFT_114910 [Thozetella sp. PMI_491]
MATVTRYFANTEAPPGLENLDFRDQLVKSITLIVRDCAPKNPWTDPFKNKPVGLWTGPTALAYLFLWLSQTHPDLVVEGRTPIEWCNAYLDCGQSDITSAHDLNGWAVKNEYLAFNTVKACVTKDLAYVTKVEEALRTGYDCPDVDNEHLVGRAGTLSLLRIISHFVPESAAAMKKCMEPLIQHLLASRPWRFHGHNYIGAAHGVIGIITQIILSDPKQVQELEPYLTEMLDLQQEDGHWFITEDPNLGEPDLVHYCHGSPGFVMSFMKLRPHVPEEMQKRFDVAIERGRKEVWEKGLLTKEPNLCHGITGNMLAFEDWEQRKHFMAFTTMEAIQEGKKEGKFIKGDDPFGLYWGEAGRAWGWMIMDSGIDLGYPTYTDV